MPYRARRLLGKLGRVVTDDEVLGSCRDARSSDAFSNQIVQPLIAGVTGKSLGPFISGHRVSLAWGTVLNVHGAEIAQGGMLTLPILESLQLFEDLSLGFLPCPKLSVMEEFSPQCRQEAFYNRVVPTITGSAHGGVVIQGGQALVGQHGCHRRARRRHKLRRPCTTH